MTAAPNEIGNPDERVVTVREIVGDRETVFYAIRDGALGYWRSAEPLDDPTAWTRDRKLRADFATGEEAEIELDEIHQWREEHGC